MYRSYNIKSFKTYILHVRVHTCTTYVLKDVKLYNLYVINIFTFKVTFFMIYIIYINLEKCYIYLLCNVAPAYSFLSNRLNAARKSFVQVELNCGNFSCCDNKSTRCMEWKNI